jgi:TonB family protein
MHVAQIRFRQIRSAVFAGSVLLSPLVASAQLTGSITGTIADSTGARIYGAEVALVGTSISATSDEDGQFRIASAPTGLTTLRVRRLGFVPIALQTNVTPQNVPSHIEVTLAPVASSLSPVVVRAKQVNYTGRLAGYYQRLERQSGGYFIVREQIDHENPQMLSQLLTHVPGISSLRMRGGGGGVRMRGRNCWPLVWLDGLPMGTSEVDLDAFPPSSIQGIELYLGATSAPARYAGMRDQSSCGTILIWSRGPDTDPPIPPARHAWDLDRLGASLTIYTSDQVDKPAVLDARQPLEVAYPPSLFAAGVRGSVLVEFVVDTAGKIEDDSFSVVSSTHPLFVEAVRVALEHASYTPAFKQGVAVRQVVQQPFQFAPASRKSPGG